MPKIAGIFGVSVEKMRNAKAAPVAALMPVAVGAAVIAASLRGEMDTDSELQLDSCDSQMKSQG